MGQRRQLAGDSVNPFQDGIVRLVQSGQDAVLQVRTTAGVYHDVVRFEGVSAASFTAQNFRGFSPAGGAVQGFTSYGTDDDDVAVGGGEFNDVVIRGAGNDALWGGGGDDRLLGGDGDDLLVGGDGADTLEGGAGDDVFRDVHWAEEDFVGPDIYRGGAGTDTVMYYRGVTLDLTGRGRSTADAAGDTFSSIERFELGIGDSIVYGSSGDEWIIYGIGVLTFDGGRGFDVIDVGGETRGFVFHMDTGEMYRPGVPDDIWVTFTSVEGVVGVEGARDYFYGSSRDEMFDGAVGPSRDVVIYSGPSSGYTITTVDGVTTVWSAATGTDTLYNIEDLQFSDRTIQLRDPRVIEDFDTISHMETGDEDAIVWARGGDDRVTTGAGDDVIDGGGGADLMAGGRGDDIYYVDDARDQALEAKNEGADLVCSSVSFTLGATSYVESLHLTGSANINGTGNGIANLIRGNSGANTLDGGKGDDRLYGGAGNDILNAGSSGADKMAGEAGNDTYYVNSADDRVYEVKGEGTDLVYSSVSFTLGASSYVERLTLTGSANLNGTGNNIANVLKGNTGINVLTGFKGDDIYYVQNTGDTVIEAKDKGTDLVYSTVTFTLGASSYVEQLTLTGSANLNGTGNNIDNVLTGNSGINVLTGNKGDDIYYVQNTGDTAIEVKGQGTDLVYSSVTFTLGASSYVENLTLTGSAGINGTGNGINNVIVGNSGANRIDGLKGQDTLTGGGGADTFVWSATSHSTVSAADRITDLSNSDFIDLSAIDANVNAGGTQHFVLVDAFTNTAGQVTLDFDGTFTNLRADTNGDGVADMLVRINGDHEDFDNFIFGG